MKKVIIGVMVVVMLTCAVVWAADQATQQAPVKSPAAQMRGRGPGMPGPGGMQQAYDEMVKKREAEHQKGIAELEEIKKIAASEKATKTVEALQKMIDKRNADFKKSVEEAEKKRAEMQERIKQHQQQMATQNAETQPAKTPAEKTNK
jgi:hypothetical protein